MARAAERGIRIVTFFVPHTHAQPEAAAVLSDVSKLTVDFFDVSQFSGGTRTTSCHRGFRWS
jgi:hypothetical protein